MRFVVDRDEGGTWRWRLLDRFGRVLAISPQPHRSEAECRVMIDLVKTAYAAPVDRNP